jgi:hypothetical protein
MSEPRRYRKKPVVIEALLFGRPYREAVDFCPDLRLIKTTNGRIAFALIATLEGNMKAEIGDYIIRGVNGEFYPCKPDIFAKTYEAVA